MTSLSASASSTASPVNDAPVGTPDRLFFYSASKDAPVGKGVREIAAHPRSYQQLSQLPHWRRVLSNFHICPFQWLDLTYRSVEHAFHAVKIDLVDPDKAYLFSVESGHEIGQGDGTMVRKHRKLAVLTPAQLQEWALYKQEVLYQASRAKYEACPNAREVLLATGEAELWHIVTRGKPERFGFLEQIRGELRATES